MTLTKLLDKLYKMEANEGMVFTTKDKAQVFGNEMYIPNASTADSYIEITKEEGEILKVSLEEKYRKEIEDAHNNL